MSLNNATPPFLPKFSADATVSATFVTSLGNFVCRLFANECPITVGNFVALARGEMPWIDKNGRNMQGTPLYNGTIFHRVIKDFMIQGGDPEGNGRGGPGYRFADEIIPSLKHNKPGILSMANAGPNTNGSQFFITEVPTPHLDGRHAVFGEVTDGFDVVLKIVSTKVDANDRPAKPVVIESINIDIR
ncbi:MAG: peptidylprolyl isomerase [Deltaproteobacteria bacterium]|nr:peptidylprolyl isomerase [Deltaproteobacteria bacterium]